jgi:hypothetical protein
MMMMEWWTMLRMLLKEHIYDKESFHLCECNAKSNKICKMVATPEQQQQQQKKEEAESCSKPNVEVQDDQGKLLSLFLFGWYIVKRFKRDWKDRREIQDILEAFERFERKREKYGS